MRFTSTATFTFSLILCLARSEDHHKRAPSGFTGVRGKKSIVEEPKSAIFFDDESEDDDAARESNSPVSAPSGPLQYSTGPRGDVVKRAPSMGFVGMRGKKPWQGDPRDYMEDNDRMPKRAPNGFFGMRGKKGDDSDLSFDLEKRMHSGFFGMRGKKEDDISETPFYASEKRAPSMGFVGMRGRKDYDDSASDFEKRAPSGFFGMRGKKQWGQFALRGKKIPYQFRGKFVGVRGKKTAYEGGNGDTEPYSDSDMNRLLMQLLEDEDLRKTAADEV